MSDHAIPGAGLPVRILIFALCCAADLFVLHSAWTGREVLEGQFRRGYFEPFDGELSLAVDEVIRPIVPSCVLTSAGELGVPPGMSAVVPLAPATEYDVAALPSLAPYVVLATEAEVKPVAARGYQLSPGEARLTGGRTLALREGRLVLVPWNASLPWREDAARLSSLRTACAEADADAALALHVKASESNVHLRLGRCTLDEPLPPPDGAPPQLAVLAGPDWITLDRRPAWEGKRWIVRQLVAAVVAKVAITWWGAGLASAAALSGMLAAVAFVFPVQATLTWPITFAIGILAALVRVVTLVLRRLSARWRVAVVLGVIAVVGTFAMQPSEPRSFPPVIRRDESRRAPACAVVGYSTAGGAGLRGGHGGVSEFLDENCERCREATGSLSAGGEVLSWARDAYCASESSFGANGRVVFFGAANDDFLWGLTSFARLFIVGEQGAEPWRRNQGPAAAASRASIDRQVSALEGLMQCARSRHAEFLFLHDFLVTDLVAGRDADRAAMLARRRAAVEAAGGKFVDLLDVFGAEAGIAWFNDYVHPSAVGHERIAEVACQDLS
jgi:hypothetical protein